MSPENSMPNILDIKKFIERNKSKSIDVDNSFRARSSPQKHHMYLNENRPYPVSLVLYEFFLIISHLTCLNKSTTGHN